MPMCETPAGEGVMVQRPDLPDRGLTRPKRQLRRSRDTLAKVLETEAGFSLADIAYIFNRHPKSVAKRLRQMPALRMREARANGFGLV